MLLHKKGKTQLKESERKHFANKYIPIALNKLYMMLTHQETIPEENMGV